MSLKSKLSAVVTLALVLVPSLAFADEGATKYTANAWFAAAAGFAIGVAALGGALGQGKAASAALEGIGRNPAAADKLFTPMLLSLAIIESLVIYSLVISFMLLGKF